MSRILVIGGSGYLGALLVPALERAGHEVTVLSLEQQPLPTLARCLFGNRHDAALLRRLATEDRFDGIVDLIAYHAADVTGVVDAWRNAPHRLSRYVLLSTLAAVAGFRTPWATEDSAIEVTDPDDDYGSGKAACERVLVAAAWQGFPGTILRSAPVFGPGDTVSRENYVVQRLLLGLPIPCLSAPDAIVTRVFVHDLVLAIVNCFARSLPAGRAYHLAQRENVSVEHYVQTIADLVGRAPHLQRLTWEHVAHAGLNPASLPFGDMAATIRFSIDRAVGELGFRPTPFWEALKQTIETIRDADPFTHPAWPGRSSTQSRLAGTQQHLQLEAERTLWDDKPTAILDDDELIELLVDSNRCATLSFDDWPAIDRLQIQADMDAVLIPEQLRAWLTLHPPPARMNQRPRLQAAIEPVRNPGEGEFYLYSRALLRRARGYSFANSPIVLQIRAFREFAAMRSALPIERIILAVRDRADAEALCVWLEHCEEQQAVVVSDIAATARVYLVDAAGWASLAGGTGWQAEVRAMLAARNPRLGQWCGAFEACRRLLKQQSPAIPVGPSRLTRDAIVSSQQRYWR
jgi:nucleoside-diphosphate-sugar epimerase